MTVISFPFGPTVRLCFPASRSVIVGNVFKVPDDELWAELMHRAFRAGPQHLPFFFFPLAAVPMPEIQERIPKPLRGAGWGGAQN